MFTGLGTVAISYSIEHTYAIAGTIDNIFSIPNDLDISSVKKYQVEESGLIWNVYIWENENLEGQEKTWINIEMECNQQIKGEKCSGQFNMRILVIRDKIMLTCSQCDHRVTIPISRIERAKFEVIDGL